VRGMGVSPLQGPKLAEILVQQGKLTSISQGNRTLLIASDRLEIIEGRILEILQKLHTEKPLLMAHDRQAVLAQLSYVKNEELLQKLLENLIQKKQIVVHGRGIARRDFKPKLSINQIKLKDQVVEAHLKAGFQPPEPSTFGPKASGNTALLMEIFEVACAEGLLVKISDTIYLHAEHVAEMQSRLTQKMAEQPALTVAEIRDLLGTTRKYAVPICEYLDRVGITRREGDYRYLAKPIPPSAV
ncbi:MAG: SelB C-terminal domain-containing protein, partial [Gemmataceae bacterium]|nr:SelB C-terminal domain-containing protein [Gemmataceae bacterium]